MVSRSLTPTDVPIVHGSPTSSALRLSLTELPAYASGQTAGKDTWFCISHPKLPDMAYYFKGEPSKCSFNEIAVNAALETTLYVAYQGGADIQAAPTFVSA